MIDGWLVRGTWGGLEYVWVVVGYEHPEWGSVAAPYRVLGRRVPPLLPGRLAGPTARLPCMGREVVVIPDSMKASAVDPESALKARLKDLPPQARELAEITGAEGLTGSWALGLETPGSDVDLIAFGREALRALRDAVEEGLVHRCPGGKGPKWGPPAPPAEGPVRLTDACFKGTPYTLRLLERREALPCTRRRWLLGFKRAVIKLEPLEPYVMPARYAFEEPGLGRGLLESWHTRYTGLPAGVYAAEIAVYYVEGVGLVASPDLQGYLKPARGHRLDVRRTGSPARRPTGPSRRGGSHTEVQAVRGADPLGRQGMETL